MASNNPYFDGVGSPITTQGEITVNCRAEMNEVAQRRNNMTKNALRAMSYPGGEDVNNLHIMPHEIVCGWKNRRTKNQIPGYPSQVGFSSLNGIHFGSSSTDEELENRLTFIGVAKTPYKFDDPAQLKHGFACIAIGSCTIHNSGPDNICPGDRLMYSVQPRSSFVGGADTTGRFGNPTIGTPRGKIRFQVRVSKYNDMRPSLNLAVSKMLKSSKQDGVADVPFESLIGKPPAGQNVLTASQELALALRVTTGVTIVRGVKILRDLGIDLDGTELELCQAMGVFANDAGGIDRMNKIINNIYPTTIVNAAVGMPIRTAFEQAIPNGFSSPGVFKADSSLDARYARVAMNLGSMQFACYARAVHVVARRRFGFAVGFGAPKQGVDVVLGHHIESF